MSSWEERQRQAEQEMCDPATALHQRALLTTTLMLVAGGTEVVPPPQWVGTA